MARATFAAKVTTRDRPFMTMPIRAAQIETTNNNRTSAPIDPVEECQGLRMLNFGSRLSQARHEAGLTTEAAAEIMGMTRQQISNWEAGRYRPQLRPEKIGKFQALADRLGVRFEWLMDGEEPMRRGGELAPQRKGNLPATVIKAIDNIGNGASPPPIVSDDELRSLERDLRTLLDRVEDMRNRLRGR